MVNFLVVNRLLIKIRKIFFSTQYFASLYKNIFNVRRSNEMHGIRLDGNNGTCRYSAM